MAVVTVAARRPTRTHVRWVPILALVAVGTAINYLDRTVLGIAAPFLTKDLGPESDPDGAGVLGVLVELRRAADSRRHLSRSLRHAGHLLHRHGVLVAFTGLMGFVQLAVRRCWPRGSASASSKRHAFPPTAASSRRGFRSTSAPVRMPSTRSASMSGSGFLSLPLFWITQRFGWRGLFFIVGGLGIVFSLVLVGALPQSRREPRRSTAPSSSTSRREAAASTRGSRSIFKWRHIVALLRHRQVIGASIGQFGGNSTQVFFVTWFPTYLVTRARDDVHPGRHHDLAAVHRRRRWGSSIGGIVSDTILKRTGSANVARKLPIVAGMLLASTIILANYVPAGQQRARDLDHVDRVLRPGHDQPGMDGRVGHRAEEADRADGRAFSISATNLAGIVTPLVIGITFQMTRHIRRAADLHRRGRAARRVRLQRDPRRHPTARRRDQPQRRLPPPRPAAPPHG